MVWNAESERGSESRKIRWALVPWTRGRGLDVGSGALKPFEHFIGVDARSFDIVGLKARADIQADASDMAIFGSQSMDFVFSSHVFQEMEDWKKQIDAGEKRVRETNQVTPDAELADIREQNKK